MIDAKLLPLQRKVLALPARILADQGISADHISMVGFGFGVLALPALWMNGYGLAMALLVLNRVADGLDGAVAREVGPTDRGAFLDVSLDFLFYALFPLGFALANPAENALAAAVLIAAFVGTGSSFLAFSIMAAKRGLKAEDFPQKGIYYLGGLTEGAETIAVFVLMCVFPSAFSVIALIYATACFATTALRWHQGWMAFSDPEQE